MKTDAETIVKEAGELLAVSEFYPRDGVYHRGEHCAVQAIPWQVGAFRMCDLEVRVLAYCPRAEEGTELREAQLQACREMLETETSPHLRRAAEQALATLRQPPLPARALGGIFLRFEQTRRDRPVRLHGSTDSEGRVRFSRVLMDRPCRVSLANPPAEGAVPGDNTSVWIIVKPRTRHEPKAEAGRIQWGAFEYSILACRDNDTWRQGLASRRSRQEQADLWGAPLLAAAAAPQDAGQRPAPIYFQPEPKTFVGILEQEADGTSKITVVTKDERLRQGIVECRLRDEKQSAEFTEERGEWRARLYFQTRYDQAKDLAPVFDFRLPPSSAGGAGDQGS